MILADTSAWIEFDRATGSPVDRRMVDLATGNGRLTVTEPVVMEVLAGATTDVREEQLRRLLSQFRLLTVSPASDFDTAARIYRRCRRAGFTPRGTVDCLVAAISARTGAVLLHRDRDLARIAEVVGLSVDPSSALG